MANFVVIVLLIAITYEDFRYRAVRFLFFPVLIGALIVSRLSITSGEILAVDMVINVTYLLVFLGVGFLFLRIKKAVTISSTGNYIGLGDVFMMLAISCWLDPITFVVFNTVSLSLALIFHIIFKRFTAFYTTTETIPLAGVQSICFLIFFISDFPLHTLHVFN